jgi:hypothetical protein
MVCGRGSGLGQSDWGGLLSGPGLSGVTELNGLAWSPDRRAAVLATLERVARREATPHVDLRCSPKFVFGASFRGLAAST